MDTTEKSRKSVGAKSSVASLTKSNSTLEYKMGELIEFPNCAAPKEKIVLCEFTCDICGVHIQGFDPYVLEDNAFIMIFDTRSGQNDISDQLGLVDCMTCRECHCAVMELIGERRGVRDGVQVQIK